MPKYTELKNETEVITSPYPTDSDTAPLLENEMTIDDHHEEAEDTGMESDNPFHANAERIDARIMEEGYVYPEFKQRWYTRAIEWFKSIGRKDHSYDFNNPLSDAFSEEKGAIDLNITGFGNPLYVFPQEKLALQEALDLQDAKISDKSELKNKEDTASNKPWYKRVYSAMSDWAQSARKGIVSGMVGLLQSMRYMIDTAIAKIESSVDTDVKKSAGDIGVDDIDADVKKSAGDIEFSLTEPKNLLVQRERKAVDNVLNPSAPPYPDNPPAYEDTTPSDHEVLQVSTRIKRPQHQKVQQEQQQEQDLITF